MTELMKTLRTQHKQGIAIVSLLVLLSVFGCGPSTNDKPSPAAARQLLKLRGYDFDEKSFFSAVAANDVIAVNTFLAAGIDPNTKEESSERVAIISAASSGNLEIVKVLLHGGADVNATDKGGYTALLRALESKHDEIADVLLAQPRVALNVQGANGVTVLMSYVWHEREDVVQSLLARSADVNLQDADGDTALHGAAQRGNVNITRMLLAKGANPNAKNKLGGTPLMWAGVYGHEDVARALLEKGADATARDNDGMTAAAWATKNKREEMAQFLRAAEKKH
jgi:ankyrin repeat protein